MNDTIDIIGIETNNLKNIDVSFKKLGINLIVGHSGSGKSSLAYDTVASIGQHEMLSMYADDVSEPSYKVKAYRNMIAAVPIKQLNHNNNMRSTIGTYFGHNRNIAFLYAASLGMSEDFFVLNKESNLCSFCHGIGYTKVADENRIINYDVALEKNPFKCWNRYEDFYCEIIKAFCEDNVIDYKKTFRQLTAAEKNLLLFGESEKKYSVRFKKNSSFSRRTTKYYGIMTDKPMMVNFSLSEKYYSEKECEHCEGKKYSAAHDEHKLLELSIGEFMTTPFECLSEKIHAICAAESNSSIRFALDSIARFVDKAVELGLGHLFFNRAIPTLSGGELQRLRLVQVFTTQLSDLLIVLDEPLAGLSGEEKKRVYANIIELSNRHTLAIVEHSDIFVKDSAVVIALGEKSGKYGGSIIDAAKYLESQQFPKIPPTERRNRHILLNLKSKVYKYSGINMRIAVGALNLITGKSGVGKSTILREYFPQYFEQYEYINQRPLLGNKNSSVATALNIFSQITNAYAKKFNKDKGFFSNLTGCDGACPICGGAGYVEYGNDSTSMTKLTCKECDGTGFHKSLLKYKLSDRSIYDIWKMTIDEAIEFFMPFEPKVTKPLITASEILLGHLLIGQPTSTLSGGENIRIKILKSSKGSAIFWGIDEPFKGLGNTEVASLLNYFEKRLDLGSTIIIAEHNEESFYYFYNKLEIHNNNGVLEGTPF